MTRQKIVVDLKELPSVIVESVRRTLLGHAGEEYPKGFTIAGTSRGPELRQLGAGQLEDALREIGNNVAATIWASGIEIDFHSEDSEADPSLFVVDLRERWEERKGDEGED